MIYALFIHFIHFQVFYISISVIKLHIKMHKRIDCFYRNLLIGIIKWINRVSSYPVFV